jgi:hypothetical protein
VAKPTPATIAAALTVPEERCLSASPRARIGPRPECPAHAVESLIERDSATTRITLTARGHEVLFARSVMGQSGGAAKRQAPR